MRRILQFEFRENLGKITSNEIGSKIIITPKSIHHIENGGVISEEDLYSVQNINYALKVFRSYCRKQSNRSVIRIFSNSLFYNIVVPYYSIFVFVKRVLDEKSYNSIYIAERVNLNDCIPVFSALGDISFRIPWSRSPIYKLVIDLAKNKQVNVCYKRSFLPFNKIRRFCVFLLKFCFVSVSEGISRLTKFPVRNFPESRIIKVSRSSGDVDKSVYLPDFSVLKNPGRFFKSIVSSHVALKTIRFRTVWSEFNCTKEPFHLSDGFELDLDVICKGLLLEYYERFAHFFYLKKNLSSSVTLISTDFVNPLGFLQGEACRARKSRIEFVQSFAVNKNRIIDLPIADERVYVDSSVMKSFSEFDEGVKQTLRELHFEKVDLSRRLSRVLIMSQPNFSGSDVLSIRFALNKEYPLIRVDIRPHPRDGYVYPEDSLDLTEDVDESISRSDLVIGKTSYTLYQALVLGVPFVSVSETLQDISYLSHGELTNFDNDSILSLMGDYKGFLYRFSIIRDKYYQGMQQ